MIRGEGGERAKCFRAGTAPRHTGRQVRSCVGKPILKRGCGDKKTPGRVPIRFSCMDHILPGEFTRENGVKMGDKIDNSLAYLL